MTAMHTVRRAARSFGLEVVRANPMTAWRCRLPALLAREGLDLVLDVGANDGGFAVELLENGYTGKIVSFEPLPDAWERLNAKASGAWSSQWSVAPRMALSDRDGEAEFHEAGNSASSSLLKMTNAHLEAAPHTATVNVHKVTTRRLDDVITTLGVKNGAYLKLDVQGAERIVLDGAKGALSSSIRAIQLEMSLTTLYEGQTLAGDMDAFVRGLGFTLWDMVPGFRDPKTLRLMQYDGIYLRAR